MRNEHRSLIGTPRGSSESLRPDAAVEPGTRIAQLIGGASWLFGAEINAQTRVLTETLPDAWRSLERRIGETAVGERAFDWLRESAPEGSGVLAGVGKFLLSLGTGVIDTVLVLVGGIYLASQPELYRTGLLKLMPRGRRELATETLDAAGGALRLWLLAQAFAMAVIGVLTAIGLSLIGVPSAVALGLIAGLAEFVPLAGPVLAAIPALLVALTVGPDVALWTLALYVFLQQVEGNVLMPLVQQRAVLLPPALTLFALIAAGLLFGVIGILLAAPLTVVVYVAVKKLYVQEALDTPTPVPGENAGER